MLNTAVRPSVALSGENETWRSTFPFLTAGPKQGTAEQEFCLRPLPSVSCIISLPTEALSWCYLTCFTGEETQALWAHGLPSSYDSTARIRTRVGVIHAGGHYFPVWGSRRLAPAGLQDGLITGGFENRTARPVEDIAGPVAPCFLTLAHPAEI